MGGGRTSVRPALLPVPQEKGQRPNFVQATSLRSNPAPPLASGPFSRALTALAQAISVRREMALASPSAAALEP
jgi:hypothetical protein